MTVDELIDRIIELETIVLGQAKEIVKLRN